MSTKKTALIIKSGFLLISIYLNHDLHVWIVRTAATFGRYPSNVLRGIFDVTGFTMHAVLRIDNKLSTFRIFDHFVYTRWARAGSAYRGKLIEIGTV